MRHLSMLRRAFGLVALLGLGLSGDAGLLQADERVVASPTLAELKRWVQDLDLVFEVGKEQR